MMKIGLNVFERQMLTGSPEFALPLGDGADFVFCHTSPEPLGFADEYERRKSWRRSPKSAAWG